MKSKILEILRNTRDYVSGQELCESLGKSRTAVWKNIHQLQEEGYEIEAVKNKGYRLKHTPDILSAPELHSIRQGWLGEEIFYYDTIGSTNTKACQLAEEGHPSGTLVVADCQEAGKGRRGRTWVSPPGNGIWMTLLLKPQINPNHASMLTLVTALAVAEGMAAATGAEAGIKWPNDLVIGGKKVCGILTEMSAQIDYVNYVVIGIGINVHNTDFPAEIETVATSIDRETGSHCNRAALIEAILQQFEKYYEIFLQTEDLSKLTGPYNEKLVNCGAKVRVLDEKEPFEGVAQGITEKGELLVETQGVVKKVVAGEVSVRGIYGYV